MATKAFTKTFKSRKLPFCGIFTHLIQFIVSMLTNSQYSSHGLEKVLQTIFEERTLLQWFQTAIIGTKIAITASKVADSSTCLFTNYNDGKVRVNYKIIGKPVKI